MNFFRELVNQSDMNINQLAKKTGIPNQNLYDYANGKLTNPSLETGFKIADALNIDINKLRGAFKKEEQDEMSH